MWDGTSQKNGGNALGLKRMLGFGSYQTAWSWLHKLRRAMVRPDRERLSGRVEVDETYVGGKEQGVRGRQIKKKAIVVIAIEVLEPKGFGRVRFRQITDVSADSLVPFVRDVIVPESTVLTDGWQGYARLSHYGYTHEKASMSASGNPAQVTMPGVHRVASLRKRWLLGTHHGAVSNKHLDYYLGEYTFRFNRRTSKARGLLFYRLRQQSMQTSLTPYRQLVGGRPHLTHGSEE
ncbi:hypothetical protein HKBW3S03_01511, partial [Candidatus Hakubella thermalkaliphila]